MFVDNLLLWLHVAAAIFCVGPVTVATSFTPRYIRRAEPSVVRFLLRSTRIFGILTLLVFITGIALGRDRLAEPWLTVSMTLFIIAFALLFAMVQRDQSAALKLLTAEAPTPAADADGEGTEAAGTAGGGAQTARIAAFSGLIALLWLVILVFMVWQPGS